VLLGRWRGHYLRHDGPEHVLCFAPTRSGKGVGLVVPTLLTWPGSAIVHDIKGENWTLTSGWRARSGRVLLFDPTNAQSAAYNPLLEVRRGEWEVRDVQNIADVLVDPEGALGKRNHWEKTSHALLVGTILHVLYAEPDKTLAGVANFLSDPKRPIEATLRAMMTAAHLGETGVHPVVASAARELLNKSENERSGVLSTAMSFLGLYRDPVVATVTRQEAAQNILAFRFANGGRLWLLSSPVSPRSWCSHSARRQGARCPCSTSQAPPWSACCPARFSLHLTRSAISMMMAELGRNNLAAAD
jgi:type IV secretion system protein VirD4